MEEREAEQRSEGARPGFQFQRSIRRWDSVARLGIHFIVPRPASLAAIQDSKGQKESKSEERTGNRGNTDRYQSITMGTTATQDVLFATSGSRGICCLELESCVRSEGTYTLASLSNLPRGNMHTNISKIIVTIHERNKYATCKCGGSDRC